MVSLQLKDKHYVATNEKEIVVGRVEAKGRTPLGGGTEFFLVLEELSIISFKATMSFDLKKSNETLESDATIPLSRELGRYPFKDRTLLAIGSDFFIIKDGRWYITVDENANGIARDLTDDEFIGIESILVNIPKNEWRELIAFRHGEWVFLYDQELNQITRRLFVSE